MSAFPASLLHEVADLLGAAARDGAEPRALQRRLATLARGAPGVTLDLLWERDGFDGSLRYDAILRRDGGSSLSIGAAPARALPVALAGAHRFEDRQLLRVDGETLAVEHAMHLLDPIWDERRLLERLVHVCVVKRWSVRLGIEPDDDVVQETLDAFRRMHGLFTVAATEAWLAQRGMTHEQLEAHAQDIACTAVLRRHVVGDRVDAWFAEHAARADTLVLTTVDAASAEALAGAGAALATGAASAWLAEHAASGVRITTSTTRPLDARGALADALAEARAGAIVGPLADRGRWLLARVLVRRPATLDVATRDAIELHLFEEWLAAQAAAAHVEWFWGRASAAEFADAVR